MKKVFLVILGALALSACVSSGQPRSKMFNSNLCGEVPGYTVSLFAYGEGKMLVVPLSKVRRGNAFVIGLKPLDGYENASVKVTQTSGTPNWIGTATGQYANLPKMGFFTKYALLEVGCAPNAVGSTYKFAIEVTEGAVKNTLDPRAEVVN